MVAVVLVLGVGAGVRVCIDVSWGVDGGDGRVGVGVTMGSLKNQALDPVT